MLQKLGYSPNEADVYLAILKLGEGTVADIAKRSGIPRTSCYYILESLKRQGLVSSYTKKKRPYWVIEDPAVLEERLKYQAQFAHGLLPALKLLRPKEDAGPLVRFYEDTDGVNDILNDIIKERQDILVMGSYEAMTRILSEDHVLFIQRRYKTFLKVKYITNKSPRTLLTRGRDKEELRQTRFLPDSEPINNISCIYGNKVALISLNIGKPTGIIFNDADTAKMQRIMFEELWEKCS